METSYSLALSTSLLQPQPGADGRGQGPGRGSLQPSSPSTPLAQMNGVLAEEDVSTCVSLAWEPVTMLKHGEAAVWGPLGESRVLSGVFSTVRAHF